jgi:internalin A
LTNLASLTLDGNAPTNLAVLTGLPNLISLSVVNCSLSSPAGIGGLVHLQTLYLGYNNLNDPAPLSGLTNLTCLSLSGNPLTSIGALAGLSNLATLDLSSCSLATLSGLHGLANLQSLYLGYNNLHDPAPLAALTNLTYLDLSGNPLTGVSALAGLSKLTTLDLSRCSLTTLSGLHGLPNLQFLQLAYNGLHDLSPLAGLTNLNYLILDSNPLTSVAGLAGLPRLDTLRLGNCSLTNLASLQGCSALRWLYLQNNGIHDLASMPLLTNLSDLYLGGNSLTNVAPLAGLPALSTLDLGNCSLSNLSSVAGLTRLQSLGLAYDQVTDISALSALTNLSSLSLDANRLTSINALTNLHRLGCLGLTRNLLDLSTGSPAMTTITNLQQQGTYVGYYPQNQPPVFYGLRTNWVIRPNLPADLQFALADDVTLADQMTLTVSSSSAGPLSNSAVTLSRTWLVNSPSPGPPILPPPPLPPVTGPVPLDATLRMPFLFPRAGGGVSSWNLHLVSTPNETGAMTLTLTATDDTGLSTNATILVTVAPPQPLDGACLEATNLTWQSGGNSPWFSQTNSVHAGASAAQSGPVGLAEESWLETSVTGPGILSFWWKLTSASYGSSVSFTTSQGGTMALQGPADWRKVTVSIPAGACVLRWDSSGAVMTSDAACLDEVSFVPTTPNFWVELGVSPDLLSLPYGAVRLGIPPPGSATPGVTLHGEPGGLYELQVSTNLEQWSVLERTVLDPTGLGFEQWVADPAAGAGARFYRARQLPPGTTWFGPLAFGTDSSPVLQLHSQPGKACKIWASTNLTDWSLLATVSTNLTGTVSIPDPQPALPCRFYKAQSDAQVQN